MKKIIFLLLIIGIVIGSGCISEKSSTPSSTLYRPTSTIPEYSASFVSIQEITDTIGQDFSNMQQTGWYDPITKQRVSSFTDKQLGMKRKILSVYYVYDVPTDLSLSANPNLIRISGANYPINNYARAPVSKGIHRVWKVEISYDTPTTDKLPVAGSWNDGSVLRLISIGIFSSGSGNTASFTIRIQEENNLGFKEGFV